MTGPGGFSISPAEAARPEPVTLVMPASGYKAAATVTDPCGAPIPGAYVTTSGPTATPHLPPGYHGTVFVDFIVSAAHPAAGGGAKISLVLASRQTVGHASTCTAHRSPYGSPHQRPAGHRPAVQAVPAAHSTALATATAAAGGALLAVALVAACWLWWARRRDRRGAHR